MAITFNCSQCGKTVRIGDEYAGRKGRCPNCLAVIDIPRAEPAGSVLTPPEQGEQPYGARLGEDYAGPALSPSWSTVRSGLTVTYVGILITFFGALFLFLLLLGGGRPAAGLLALVGLIGLVVIVGVVMNIVGVGMCGAAPTESGGKGLAVAAAVLMVISLLTGIGLAVAESVQDQKAVRPLPGQPGLPNQPAQTEPALLMLNPRGVDTGARRSALFLLVPQEDGPVLRQRAPGPQRHELPDLLVLRCWWSDPAGVPDGPRAARGHRAPGLVAGCWAAGVRRGRVLLVLVPHSEDA